MFGVDSCGPVTATATRPRYAPRMLQQCRFDSAVKTRTHPAFEPGSMSTLLKQNKTKVFESERQRLVDSLGWMGIIIPVDLAYSQ